MSDFPEVKDHLVENPDKYTMTTNPDGTVTLRPTWVDNPSEVLQEGTPVNAAFLQKIPEAIDAIDTKVTTQLAENAKFIGVSEVTPEMFEGNALQKIQLALDYCLANKTSLRLAKMYDITGLGTIYLNKTTFLDRTPITIVGNGGGIKKTDAGIIFSAPIADVGDLFFKDVYFESQNNAGVVVFDCDKLIRVVSRDCKYRNVDTVARVNDGRNYMQSMRFKGDSIVGGRGYVYDCVGAYDCTFDDVLVEQRDNVFRQRAHTVTGHVRLWNVRFMNLVWEGLTGTAIDLRDVASVKVDGCYFEKNGKHIFFSSTAIVDSFKVSDCFGSLGGAGATALIEWGGSPKNVTSENNYCNDGAVHDVSRVLNGHYIYSKNDISKTATANILNAYNSLLIESTNVSTSVTTGMTQGDNKTRLGTMTRVSKNQNVGTLAAGETRTVQVAFTEPIKNDDLINVKLSVVDNKYIGHYCNIQFNDNKIVNIVLKNQESTTVDVQIVRVTILKGFHSTFA